jgi:DNA-binding GntR family transcriptional regulator
VISEKKERLLEQFDNPGELTAETIMAAKSFSALVDRELEGKLLKMIEKRFNEVFNEADEQIRIKNYDEYTAENLKTLSNLAGFSTQLAQKSVINNLANRLRDMKTTISN